MREKNRGHSYIPAVKIISNQNLGQLQHIKKRSCKNLGGDL
jgi:hypothetical protein